MSIEETSSTTNNMAEMSENNSLKTILSNLETIANNETDLKTQLTDCGYADCFPNESGQEQVKRVFAMAVNEAIQKKVDLAKVNTEEKEKEYLRELLGIDQSKSLCPEYFTSLQNFEKALSPLDMAEYINDVSADLVKNLIQHQFKIKWDTPTGEPKNYTFHEFCDKANATELFKSYNLRRAHVEATLYKECRRKNVVDLKAITKRELCPKVYIRTANGWKTWNAATNTFANCEDSSEWMNASIKTIIEENADGQTNDESKLKESLDKPTLYWAVVDDTDFKRGDKLKLEPIGRTQVYVGQAKRGIKGRWIADGRSHCEMMKKCLDNVCAMTTYDPLRLEEIQLVDARLTLAKVRGENTALFVMKTFGAARDVKKAEIVLKKTKTSLMQAEGSRNKTIEKWIRTAEESIRKTDDLISYQDELFAIIDPCIKQARILDSKIKTAGENLREARKTFSEVNSSFDLAEKSLCDADATCQGLTEEVERLHGELKKITDDHANAKTNLDHAEESHRQGKRVIDGSKIIENDNNIEWKPTDMAYGMNFN